MTREPSPSVWRAIPAALVVAFAAELVGEILEVLASLPDTRHSESLQLAADGVFFAATVLTIAGTFALARRTTGLAAVGMRIAGVAAVAVLALTVATEVMLTGFDNHADQLLWWFRFSSVVVWPIVEIAAALGFAIAAWRAVADAPVARALGIVAIALTLILNIHPLRDIVSAALGAGTRGRSSFFCMSAAKLVLFGVLSGFAGLGAIAHTHAPVAVVRALRGIANSISLRVWVALAMVGLMFLAMLAHADGALPLAKFAMVAGPVVNAIGLMWLGSAAITLACGVTSDEPDGRIYLGAALVLAAAMITAKQAVVLGQMVYGHDDGGRSSDAIHALAAVTPSAIIVGTILILSALATIARQRDHADLGGSANATLGPFAILAGVAVALQAYVLPLQDSVATFVAVSVVAAGCGLTALVLVSRLCRRAAIAFESTTTLPTATATIKSPTNS